MTHRAVEAILKKSLLSLAFGVGLLSFAPSSYAVTYTQVCSETTDLGFYAVPGFEPGNPNNVIICTNPANGETRQWINTSATNTVVWESILPYPEGIWVSNPQNACGQGSLVKIGSYTSSSFKLNSFQKLQTAPTSLQLQSGQFLTKIIMSGGLYDPRVPARLAANGSFLSGGPGLCVRSVDPSVLEQQASGSSVNPPFGNGGLPIGCIANQRIANAPLSYAISSTAAYQSVDAYFVNGNSEAPIAGPYTYGKQLVVTTDVGPGGPGELTYCDPTKGACGGGVYNPTAQSFSPLGSGQKPMAGTLNVWACMSGSNSQGQNNNSQ